MTRLTGETSTPAPPVGAETAVILFTDIVDSTALTERLGDAAYVAKAGEFERTLRRAVRECSGEDIVGVTLGDGVLAVFSSGTHAIECAARAHECARAAGFRLHIGIHAGDVLRTGSAVHGGAVNIAARMQASAPPGGVLVTAATYKFIAPLVEATDAGRLELKGKAEAVHGYQVTGLKRGAVSTRSARSRARCSCSKLHLLSQPSRLITLPSSHCSVPVRTPSPHASDRPSRCC